MLGETVIDTFQPAQRKCSSLFSSLFSIMKLLHASNLFVEHLAILSLQREVKILKSRMNENEDKIEHTTEKLVTLEENVAADRMQTIYTLADHSERLDHQSNQAKSHCVLITGKIKIK